MDRRTSTRALAAACLLAALSGCGAGEPSLEGPLGAPGPDSTLCTTAGDDGLVTFGVLAVQNRGEQAVELQDLELVGADGLRLRQALLLPIEQSTLVGTAPQFPPPGLTARSVWAQRQQVSDAVLEPGQDRNLLLGLEVTEDAGREGGAFDDLTLAYRDADGERYRWQPNYAVTVRRAGSAC